MRLIGFAFCRPGSDLLSRVLRQSTIGAGAFHGRVRNGNGCSHPARTTRSAKRKANHEKLDFEHAGIGSVFRAAFGAAARLFGRAVRSAAFEERGSVRT